MEKDTTARSWFCVSNNPQEHGYDGTPAEIAERMADEWVKDNPQRSCAIAFCISANGLPHCHSVLEDTKTMRFSAVKKVYPSIHIQPTKGSKEQAEDYINKRGKWQEKGEQVLYVARRGEIKGAQGQRLDLEIIEDLIQQGMKPNDILALSLSYRRYEKMIRDAYYEKRYRETPRQREVKRFWHVGKPGTGKSYIQILLAEQYGDDEVYVVTDYDHPFDKYNGERFVVFDEFRGQIKFSVLMNLLDNYRVQLPCRYSNSYALWDEVHVCCVLPPEVVYEKMVSENQHLDTYGQLMRRLDFVVYHYVDDDGKHRSFELPASQYKNYDHICQLAEIADSPVQEVFEIF
ncbi:MAG: hypothetical protein ACLSS9_14860 [Acutalibacteraceae bacterium]